MIPKGPAFLPAISEDRLRALAQSEKAQKPQLRLLAALHRKQGWTLERIAGSVGRPMTTVHDWLMRLHARGLSRLQDAKQPGRPSALSRRQLRAFARELERGPPHNRGGLWTTRLVLERVRVKFGATFTPRHLRRLLHRLGFSIQRPRPRHYRADPVAQARFKKKRGDSSGVIDGMDLSSPVRTKARSASPRLSGAGGRAEAAGRLR